MNRHPRELAPEQLRCDCDPSSFQFSSTAEIPPLKGFVAQERPVRAIRFGLDIHSPGYNIYVSGLTGTGKTTVIKKFLEEIAVTMPTPDDWCYVYNFRDPEFPGRDPPARRPRETSQGRDGRVGGAPEEGDSQSLRLEGVRAEHERADR